MLRFLWSVFYPQASQVFDGDASYFFFFVHIVHEHFDKISTRFSKFSVPFDKIKFISARTVGASNFVTRLVIGQE